MFDTVHFRLKAEEVPDINLLSEITPYIELTNEGYNVKTEQDYVSGHLDNYRVSISNTGVNLKGSLSKYLFNDPLRIVNQLEAKEAIEKLSDCLHLPMNLADVSRLDITKDLEMDFKAEAYYKYLGTARCFNRLLQPKSLLYSNKRRQLFFYNKIAELKAKQIEFDRDKLSKNIMRVEYRFIKGIRKQLKQEVKGATLYNDDFYIKMVNGWYSTYKSIQKIKPVSLDLSRIKSPKDFIEYSALQYWEDNCGGQLGALEMVDELKDRGAFNSAEYYSRLKSSIKGKYKNKSENIRSDLLDELDEKMEDGYLESLKN